MMLIKKAFSPKELRDVFSLRYQVYCLERGYEVPEDHPNQIELDEYDPYSIHIIAYAQSIPVGTARLILQNPLGLPIEKYCNIDTKSVTKHHSAVEISRLAVSSSALKKALANKNKVTLALINEIYRAGKQLDIVYFFAAMSAGLERLLNRCGMRFVKAGPPVDYHGIRTPYYGLVEDFEREVFSKRGKLFIPPQTRERSLKKEIDEKKMSLNVPA